MNGEVSIKMVPTPSENLTKYVIITDLSDEQIGQTFRQLADS